VLDSVRKVSEHLAQYYGWTEAEATLFVLTGRPPFISDCKVLIRTKALKAPCDSGWKITKTIVMEIDPILTPDQVAKTYEQERKKMLLWSPRIQSQKHLALAEYVGLDRKQTWRDKMKQWNKTFPQWSYQNARNFQRDVQQATQRLLEDRWLKA